MRPPPHSCSANASTSNPGDWGHPERFQRRRQPGVDSVNEEVLDRFGDFLGMCFQREVAGVEETDGRIGNVAFEGLGTWWQKERIVLAPHCQERRFVLAEVFLEGRVQRDIALIVAKKVELDLIGAGPGEVKVVQRIAVRRNGGRVRHAVRVLPQYRLRFQKST